MSATEASDLVDGDWHHIAMVRAGTELRFYVDGRVVGDVVAFDPLPTGGGRGMLYMGSDTCEYLGNESDLHGALDEVCLFDLALEDTQIVALADHADCDALPAIPGGEDSGDTEEPVDSDPDVDSDPGSDGEPVEDGDPVLEPERRCGCGATPATGPLLLGLLLVAHRRRLSSDG